MGCHLAAVRMLTACRLEPAGDQEVRSACAATGRDPEASIVRVVLGAGIGILLMWLYQSKRVREEAQRRLSTAPESFRQAATSVRAASAGQIGRVAQAVDAAAVTQPLRDTFARATIAARATAEKLGSSPAVGQTATPGVQDTPDGP